MLLFGCQVGRVDVPELALEVPKGERIVLPDALSVRTTAWYVQVVALRSSGRRN